METKTCEWAVFNRFVTQVLGRYDSEEAAREAADEFGRCSFPCHLSPEEQVRMNAAAGPRNLGFFSTTNLGF
ncbi:hypothetical protein [Curtobacterium flaccumfaciens]|uniref:hypothetical protein n=1 Tax=Curtobacterium flaccumfaciens TaxID=2035 RepID=UPI001E3891DB|nr:hypothetical protein [Curtobacterium allii]MCE0459530.1 hypothetical protein [Curtobacterium allii]